MTAEFVRFPEPGLKVNDRWIAARTALRVALLEFAEAGGTRAEVRRSMQDAFFEAELLRELAPPSDRRASSLRQVLVDVGLGEGRSCPTASDWSRPSPSARPSSPQVVARPKRSLAVVLLFASTIR